MKRVILLSLLCFPFLLMSQNVILDFETPETSTNFQIFGGNLEGVVTNNIANPDATGVNTSATVVEGLKASDAPDWGGMFSNPNPEGGINATQGGQVCFDIWSDRAVPVLLKLENDDVSNVWETSLNTSGTSSWETLCYDLATVGNGGAPASGLFTRFVVFYDFGTVGTGAEQVFYMDNFSVPAINSTACDVIFDFEPTAPESFSTFGATDTTVVAADFTIPNPGPDGTNGSAMVMQYVKQANAEVWAGMFFDLAQPIDANTAFQVCIDYWSPNGGDLLFKLENGPDTWETLRTSSTAGGWETLCFDLSDEDAGGNASGPALGRTFTRMVLFADFGTMGAATDTDYYFDNFLVKSDFTVSDHQVTFAVDMTNQLGNFTQPYVSGTFNDWCGDCDAMEDPDGDNVWTATLSVPQGSHEFKFTADNWALQEQFGASGFDCTITDDSGQFTNRSIIVVQETTFGPFCFNSCFNCGEAVMITVNMGQGNVLPDDAGFFVAGGGNFGIPGENPMDDSDGDGNHTITFERPVGFSSFYTFTNGACGDFSCKENIAGQDCSDPDNFDDRFMAPVMQDTVINTCFGVCSDDLECGDAAFQAITFNVNMNGVTEAFTTVFLSGTFNAWSGNANPMEDADGDGIWTVSLDLLPGSYEYKFQADEWTFDEQFTDGDPCTITDASGSFVNRALEVTEDADFCFNFATCNDCLVSTNDLSYDSNLFNIVPTIVNNERINITFGSDYTDVKQLSVLNGLGQTVYAEVLNANQIQNVINLPALAAGLYFIHVETEGKHKTERILVTH